MSLPRKFMNFSSQNGLIIWCVLGVLFLRFMCPMDCSCMINFIEVPVFRSSAEGKKIKTHVKILGVATPATRAALTPMGDVRVYVMHVVQRRCLLPIARRVHLVTFPPSNTSAARYHA